MTSNFWLVSVLCTGIGLTAYAYAGFPLAITLLGRVRRRHVAQSILPNPEQPIMTVIIPAYNEQSNIGGKIQNTLASSYPRTHLDIIVVSDGSTDRTDDIVRAFEPDGVRLIVQHPRQGKTAGLNRAVAIARGELLVLTDANSAYEPATLASLAAYFGIPQVGLVSGYTRYRMTGGHVSETTNAYTSLERIIKRGESAWGCCVGADGAIFAMRRSLYRQLRHDDINDFVLPLAVIEQGYECVFAEAAVCTENPGVDLESEFRRQSRITNRTLRALWRHRHLLNPFRRPLFSFFLFSHKVARFLVPVALALSGAALLVLCTSSGLYRAGALTAALLTASAFVSRRSAAPPALLRALDAFLTINMAILDGWRKFLVGETDVTWQPDRAAIDKSA